MRENGVSRRSIVPNRSEPEDCVASGTNSRENRKTPPLARRAELLGTIALHWEPPLERRAELLGTIALLCLLEDLAYHARWVDAR